MSNKQINFIGWILFILSAIGFIIASIGSFWSMVGSVFFLVSCLCHFGDHSACAFGRLGPRISLWHL